MTRNMGYFTSPLICNALRAIPNDLISGTLSTKPKSNGKPGAKTQIIVRHYAIYGKGDFPD